MVVYVVKIPKSQNFYGIGTYLKWTGLEIVHVNTLNTYTYLLMYVALFYENRSNFCWLFFYIRTLALCKKQPISSNFTH